jgi:hypothetical protein
VLALWRSGQAADRGLGWNRPERRPPQVIWSIVRCSARETVALETENLDARALEPLTLLAVPNSTRRTSSRTQR